MESLLRRYKTEKDQLDAIVECISSDPYYIETAKCSFNLLAEYTLSVTKLYGKFNFNNPIISTDGSKIYFRPDQRDKDREGLLYSEIKYATHFVTRESVDKRFFDGGKVKYFPLIRDALMNPDSFHIVQEEILKCYYIKRITPKLNNVIVCAVNPIEGNYRRVITFMPHQRNNQTLKYKTPEAKSHGGKTEQSR